MIRFERYHNGHRRPTDWSGKGQATEYEEIKPTKWFVLVHDPDRWEGCEMHEFTSRENRESWIRNYSNSCD